VATTNFTTGRYEGSAVAYNGYVYMVGGVDPDTTADATVQYAPLNSDGTVGTWVSSNPFLNGRAYLGLVAYDGYLYIEGGGFFGANSDVQYAPIASNGSLGGWMTTSALTTARQYTGAVAYNGYLYAVGGNNGSSDITTTDYASLNGIARTGHYSKLIDLNNIAGVQSITYNGTLPGGLTNISLRTAGVNAVFGSSQGATALTGIISCASATRYAWLMITLDDSYGQGTGGAFPEGAGTNAYLTDFTLNYSTIHPQPNVRLRNGMTIQGGTQSSLDTCAS
jgi:hypothetical protein